MKLPRIIGAAVAAQSHVIDFSAKHFGEQESCNVDGLDFLRSTLNLSPDYDFSVLFREIMSKYGHLVQSLDLGSFKNSEMSKNPFFSFVPSLANPEAITRSIVRSFFAEDIEDDSEGNQEQDNQPKVADDDNRILSIINHPYLSKLVYSFIQNMQNKKGLSPTKKYNVIANSLCALDEVPVDVSCLVFDGVRHFMRCSTPESLSCSVNLFEQSKKNFNNITVLRDDSPIKIGRPYNKPNIIIHKAWLNDRDRRNSYAYFRRTELDQIKSNKIAEIRENMASALNYQDYRLLRMNRVFANSVYYKYSCNPNGFIEGLTKDNYFSGFDILELVSLRTALDTNIEAAPKSKKSNNRSQLKKGSSVDFTSNVTPLTLVLRHKEDTCQYVIVTRGTVIRYDWELNFFTRMTRVNEFAGKIHEGYYTLTRELANHLSRVVINDAADSMTFDGQRRRNGYHRGHICSEVNVILTGHSLGGALSKATAIILAERYPQIKFHVITFATPNVFDEEAANTYRKKTNIETKRSYKYELDVVTDFPCIANDGFPRCQLSQNSLQSSQKDYYYNYDGTDVHLITFNDVSTFKRIVQSLNKNAGKPTEEEALETKIISSFSQSHTCIYDCYFNAKIFKNFETCSSCL